MLNTKRLLDELVGSGAAGSFAGGLAGGALANILTGKKAAKVAGSALKIGGLALVGGIAYKAWRSHQQGGTRATSAQFKEAPAGSAFMPATDDGQGTETLCLLLARAMIAAAKADGHIDTGENRLILSQIDALSIPAEEKQFLLEEYEKPLSVKALAGDVHSPEHAAEVYAASVLVVNPPSASERVYLDMLAGELGLEADLVHQIHKNVSANTLR